jgi:hypothetical protein
LNLIADKHSTEFNYQVNMINTLLRMNFDAQGEVVPKGYHNCRFDVCIMDGRKIIGIIEMKRHITGNMRQHECEFWITDQGKRYREIGIKFGIPVLYCAGPSEINRVAREMKRALMPWYLRWLYMV